jgi:hypothetical protein
VKSVGLLVGSLFLSLVDDDVTEGDGDVVLGVDYLGNSDRSGDGHDRGGTAEGRRGMLSR